MNPPSIHKPELNATFEWRHKPIPFWGTQRRVGPVAMTLFEVLLAVEYWKKQIVDLDAFWLQTSTWGGTETKTVAWAGSRLELLMPIVAREADRVLQGEPLMDEASLMQFVVAYRGKNAEPYPESRDPDDVLHLLIELRETLIMRYADGVVELLDPAHAELLQRIDAVLVSHGCVPTPLNATPTVVIEPTP